LLPHRYRPESPFSTARRLSVHTGGRDGGAPQGLRPSSGSTKPSPRPHPVRMRNLRFPSPRRRTEIPSEALPLRRPPRPRRQCPPPDPVLDDVDEDDTLAPPSARPEARRRRERRERRKGGEGVTFAPGTSGDDDDDDDRRLGGDERLRELADATNAASRADARSWSGSCSSSASSCRSRWTSPSCSRRPSRAGRGGTASRRTRAGGEPPRREKKSQKPNATSGRNSGVEDDDEFRVTKRGTAGARQRALDRADVPPELRGHVSAAQWKRELRAFHEEQVRLAAAARSAGESGARRGGDAQESQGPRRGPRAAGDAVRACSCRCRVVVYLPW
jgi:hypothetical protein